MTRAEKVAILQKKVADLMKYFEGKELPKGPFKIHPWATILDAQKYFETNIEVINAQNSNPYSRVLIMAYYRLNDLKNYMDGLIKTDSQPGTV